MGTSTRITNKYIRSRFMHALQNGEIGAGGHGVANFGNKLFTSKNGSTSSSLWVSLSAFVKSQDFFNSIVNLRKLLAGMQSSDPKIFNIVEFQQLQRVEQINFIVKLANLDVSEIYRTSLSEIYSIDLIVNENEFIYQFTKSLIMNFLISETGEELYEIVEEANTDIIDNEYLDWAGRIWDEPYYKFISPDALNNPENTLEKALQDALDFIFSKIKKS